MLKISVGERTCSIAWYWLLGGLLIGLAILGSTSVATWEYTNSNSFCTNACHAVHPEEPVAHQYSRHTNVQCVECHLGRISFFKSVFVKATHLAHVWSFLTGYERPLSSYSMPVSTESCESCHSPQPHKKNVVKVYSHFAEDKLSTETKIGMVLRHVGRQTAEQSGTGIQWHANNQIRFIATDEQKQNIPWVEVTRTDGSITVYNDITQPLPDDDIGQRTVNLMECKDCHNRTGHPFHDPEKVLDAAIANGTLDRRLPFIKQRTNALLMKEFKTEEEAQQLVEEAWQKYAEDFPELANQFPQAWADAKKFLEKRQTFMTNLMNYARFQKPGISWRSFPENIGHTHSAGCFRCHNGKLRDSASNPVPVNCTTCHGVPMPFKKGNIPRYILNTINMTKPASHRKADFMLAHWTKYTEACSACHKKFSYGTQDKEFCANSACHNIRWQNMSLRLKPGQLSADNETLNVKTP